MDNIVYFRDYKREQKTEDDSPKSKSATAIWERAMQTGFMKAYDAAMKAIPKVINPLSKASYEKVLSICEEYAQRLGGTVRGEVRYNKWDAVIDLVVPFLEFSDSSELKKLKAMSELADTVTFQSAEDGWIRVHLFFLYFDDLIDDDGKDAILERIVESDPELVRLLEEHAEYLATPPDDTENT